MLAKLGVDGENLAGRICNNTSFHFHRLNDGQRLSFANDISNRRIKSRDGAGHTTFGMARIGVVGSSGEGRDFTEYKYRRITRNMQIVLMTKDDGLMFHPVNFVTHMPIRLDYRLND